MLNLKCLPFICGLAILVFFTTGIHLNASKVEVIKDPEPNMVEKQYTELTPVKTLNPDLGNSEFLYEPYSMTTNGTHIYIYDSLQAKLFKFDKNLVLVKSYGRKGQGPGEFSGTRASHSVHISFGRDGLLYANDVFVRRLIVLDKDLKYLRQFDNCPSVECSPAVNENGAIYFFSVNEDKVIDVLDEKSTKRFVITNCKDSFKFLIEKPRFRIDKRIMPLMFTSISKMYITQNSELLFYSFSSSSLMVVKNGKLLLKKHLWPKDALNNFESERRKRDSSKSKLTRNLFHDMFMDDDVPDVFYLQYGLNKEKGLYPIYGFNTRGELLKVLYVKPEQTDGYPGFALKVKGGFYAVEDSNVKIYKISEVKK